MKDERCVSILADQIYQLCMYKANGLDMYYRHNQEQELAARLGLFRAGDGIHASRDTIRLSLDKYIDKARISND